MCPPLISGTLCALLQGPAQAVGVPLGPSSFSQAYIRGSMLFTFPETKQKIITGNLRGKKANPQG